MEAMPWTKILIDNAVLLCVVFLLLKLTVPRLLDKLDNMAESFAKSLDTITSRHSQDMDKVSKSITKMSDSITEVRVEIAGCQFRPKSNPTSETESEDLRPVSKQG